MVVNEVLSIWEVAHRWNGVDPNLSDPAALPLAVQDSLRALCRAVLEGKIGLHEPICSYADHSTPSYEPFLLTAPRSQIPLAIEDCLLKRQYDQGELDTAHINRGELFYWSVRFEQDFPDFWYSDSLLEVVGGSSTSSDSSPPQPKLRSSQLDRHLCQAIARTLWDLEPKKTIAAIARSRAIQVFGNGAQYKDIKTVRGWITEVAPAAVRKPGRPRRQPTD